VTPTHSPTPEKQSGLSTEPPPYRRLGEILLERQKIEADELERAL